MITVLDFGGQYAHLIARCVRRLNVYSEIKEAETPASDLTDSHGLILSGGPQSVFDSDSPQGDPDILKLGIPILGICYGMHWIISALGGQVRKQPKREYGHTQVHQTTSDSALLNQCPPSFNVWMSHGDSATILPAGFSVFAKSDHCPYAAVGDEKKKQFGLQFHPEVAHTEHGMQILENFVCQCNAPYWSIGNYLEHIKDQIRQQAGQRKVLMLTSGGVDSTVALTLLNQVLGVDHVQGLLIDNGLMRKNEAAKVMQAITALGINNLMVEDASPIFLDRLANVTDPEEKRRIIGNTFIDVKDQVVQRIIGKDDENNWLLGQGTIYPDTIETGGTKHSAGIKLHHNRSGKVQELIAKGLVIEPLSDLYKDDVRELGETIGLPHEVVWRHPFPGPGLGVRILCASKPELLPDFKINFNPDVKYSILPVRSVGVQGDERTYSHALTLYVGKSCDIPDAFWQIAVQVPNITDSINRVVVCLSHNQPHTLWFTPTFIEPSSISLAREADAIVIATMERYGLYDSVWQFPVVLLPFGVMPGNRSIVLRPVESREAMTANAAKLKREILVTMIEQLLRAPEIDTVFYDLTSKPPATIEWE
ncbi:MAG: glutamine-hydrolyzing GMP synthase [bacterium]|nr:glutamine-hydrolyzing GMP synthase [bacterium]